MYINKCGTENKKNCQKIRLCLLIPAGIVSSTRRSKSVVRLIFQPEPDMSSVVSKKHLHSFL